MIQRQMTFPAGAAHRKHFQAISLRRFFAQSNYTRVWYDCEVMAFEGILSGGCAGWQLGGAELSCQSHGFRYFSDLHMLHE